MEYNEVVEWFLKIYIREIKKEDEVPNINFIFDDGAFDLFRNLARKPYFMVRQEDYEYLISPYDESCLNIKVHDYNLFFKLLTCIVNEAHKLYTGRTGYSMFGLLRRIWLKMGINDIENVELFLSKQLEFLTDRTFSEFDESCNDNPILITKYENCDIYMSTGTTQTWDESTREMTFLMANKDGEYLLPRILYDIDSEKTCYIYGIQSFNRSQRKNKRIERKLYKLNNGINEPSIHPSKVLALLLFIDQLEKKEIAKIMVPSIQVLSYRYHELLSKEAANFKDIDSVFYERFYDKQDLISKSKTEDLIKLMYRIAEHKPNLEIMNEVNLQGDYLIIRNNNIKVKKR